MGKHLNILLILCGSFTASLSFAGEYERFDGHVYNGLYYPNIDMIAWGEPLHLEFQIYDKKNKIDISGVTIDSGGRPIFWLAIDLNHRGERRCRRIVAPPSFKPNAPLYYYYEDGDHEMNNVIVSAQPIAGKKLYKPRKWRKCTEVAARTHKKGPPVAKQPGKERTPAAAKGPSTIFDENSKDQAGKRDSQYDYRPIPNDFDWVTDRKENK